MVTLPLKDKIYIPFLLWCLASFAFLLLFKYGYHTSNEQVIYFHEYAPHLYKDTKNSLLLIFPALIATFFFAIVIFCIRTFLKKMFHKQQRFIFFVDIIPTIYSAIPLFVTGIIFIRYFKLNTLYSYNFFYGILCLCLFNVNYLYNKLKKCLEQEYQKPYVAYAHSIGISENDIFRYYVLPGIVPYVFSTLRELLPHLIVESIVIEYTFSYNALLRTTIQALQYGNNYYLAIFICEMVLLLYFFEMFCRYGEKIVKNKK